MKLIISILFVGMGIISIAQTEKKQFPEEFYGIYKGDLEITNTQGKQTIQMEFHLNPTDSTGKYDYVIVYVMNGDTQKRAYSLLEKDKANGIYQVDENNGILLDAKCIGNTLFSMFEVQGNILTTTERFYEDAMDFEITFASKQNANTSKTTDENPIDVISYPITVLQKAHLVKE